MAVFYVVRPTHASGPSSNSLMNYQARVTDLTGAAIPDGPKNVKFLIWDDPTAGACLYSARGTCGTPTAKSVTVVNGVFTTYFGEAGDNALPASVFVGSAPRYLEIHLESATPSVYEILSPRRRISSAAFAMNADLLDDLDTSSLGGTAAFVPVTDASGLLTLTGLPTVSAAVITANPAAPPANGLLFEAKNNGISQFTVDAEGDAVLAGDLTVDVQTLHVDAANGIVGIGTASPKFGLTVVGDFTVDTNGADGADWQAVPSTPYAGSYGVAHLAPGTPLVSAAGQNLCTDDLAAPDVVRKDLDADCTNNGGTDGTYILGPATTAATIPVDSTWAFNDTEACGSCVVGDGIYQLGQDLFIDRPPLGVFNSPGIKVADETTGAGTFISNGQINFGKTPWTNFGGSGDASINFYSINPFNGYAGIGLDANGKFVFQNYMGHAIWLQPRGNNVMIGGIGGSRVGINTRELFEALTVSSGDAVVESGYLASPFGGFGRYENLLQYSEQLDNSVWVKNGMTVTANTTALADPIGTNTADRLPDSNTTGQSDVGQTVAAAAGQQYTFSAWIAGYIGANTISISLTDNGTTPATTARSFTPDNWWHRYQVTHTASAGSTQVTAKIDYGTLSVTGAFHINVWGAQLENRSEAGVYAKAEGATIPTGRGLAVASPGPHLIQSGNVGIGTTAPIAQLDVAGRIPATATGSVATGSSPYELRLQGNYAYVVARGANTFQTFDISDPSAPVFLASVPTASQPISVDIQGKYAYVATYTGNTLQVIDISNPKVPITVGTTATTGGPFVNRVSGKYVYIVCDLDSTIKIFDVSDPAAPVQVGSAATGSRPRGLDVYGRYAYVTSYFGDKLEIFDVSDPAAPSLVGTAAGVDGPWDVYVQGGYAYVAGYSEQTLKIYDVSDPALPTALSTTPVVWPFAMDVYGRYVYIAKDVDQQIQVIDVSNPTSPMTIGNIPTGSDADAVRVQGRYVYFTGPTPILEVFDVGGAFIQNFESGSIKTGALAVSNNIQAMDADLRGSLAVAGSILNNGNLGVAGTSYFGGNVGIGTTGPDGLLTVNAPLVTQGSFFEGDEMFEVSKTYTSFGRAAAIQSVWDFAADGFGIYGLEVFAQTQAGNTNNMTGSMAGFIGRSEHLGTGLASDMSGVNGIAGGRDNGGDVTTATGVVGTALAGAGTVVTNGYGVKGQNMAIGAGGIITNSYALTALEPAELSSGSVTNNVGLAVADLAAGTANTDVLIGTLTPPGGNYSIYNVSSYNNYFAGNVGIGDASPASLLTVGSGDAFRVDNIGNVTTLGDMAVEGGDITTSVATFNLAAGTTTLNLAGGSGSTGCTIDGSGNLVCTGSVSGSGMSVTGNLSPSVDNTYDLGTTALRWRKLELGPGSLELSSTAGTSGSGSDYTLGKLAFDGTNLELTTAAVGAGVTGTIQIATGTNTGITVDTAGGIGLGTVFSGTHHFVNISGSRTVNAAEADYYDFDINPTLNASANDQAIVLMRLRPYGSNGAFTNVRRVLLANENAGGGQHSVQLYEGGLRLGSYTGGAAAFRSPSANLELDGWGSSSTTYTMQVENANGDDVFSVRDDAAVAIGTFSPAARLHVVGGESIGAVRFLGSGLDDMTPGGTYSGTSNLRYRVQIDGVGAPDTFRWSDDGGATWDATAVAITGAAQTLNNGVTVTFAATTGHTNGNYWNFNAYSADPLLVQGTGGVNALFVSNDGDVGVGTTSPTARLTVQGGNDLAVLGSDIVTNGGFTGNASGWTLGTNWAYNSDNVIHTTGAAGDISQAVTVTSGVPYQVKFTANTTTVGALTPKLGAVNGSAVGQSTGSVNYEIVLIAGASGSVNLTFSADGTWAGTLDTVSVKPITISDVALSVRNSDGSTNLDIRPGGSGTDNFFLGRSSGQSMIFGVNNTAVGSESMMKATNWAVANTALGYWALRDFTTGWFNTAIGEETLVLDTTGQYNTAVGAQAMFQNTIGNYNTALGLSGLTSNRTGSYNTSAGVQALANNVTGSYNTAVGYQAGYAGTAVTSGTYNTFLGYGAGLTGGDGTLTNAAAIGYNARVSASNSLVLGGTGANTVNIGINTTLPLAKLEVLNGAVLFDGTTGSTPVSGAGTRLMWVPDKQAIRAGMVQGTQWDAGSIGLYSAAFGQNTTASGQRSFAAGYYGTASGESSTAMGYNTTAGGQASYAAGQIAQAGGNTAVALGYEVNANSDYSLAAGQWVTASTGANAMVIGRGVSNASRLTNTVADSLAVGFNSTVPTFFVGPSGGAGTTGHVGVGTTAPLAKLTVSGGDIHVDDGNLSTPTGGFGNYVNHLVYSEQFNQATWTKTGVTVTANSVISPDGLQTADTIGAGGAAADGVMRIVSSPPMLVEYGNKTWTGSVWLKAVSGAPSVTLVIDGNSTSEPGTRAFALDSEWRRYSVTHTFTTGTGWPIFEIRNGTNAIYAWGAQLEYASSPGVYARTENSLIASNTAGTPNAGLVGNGSLLFYGSTGDTPMYGDGTRMMWVPSRSAVRAGYGGNNWQHSNIGTYSAAFGYDTRASGSYSLAGGNQSIASGTNAFAFGAVSNATGFADVAMGSNANATGGSSVALGGNAYATGGASMALGSDVGAYYTLSTAIGHYLYSNADHAMVFGHGADNANRLNNTVADSLMVGFNSNIPTLFVGPSTGVGTTGRIGIGDTSPLEKLTVAGGSILATNGGVYSSYGGFGRYENYLTYSEQLDHANWTKTGVTVTANTYISPDGTAIAESLNAGVLATDNISQAASGAPATASTTWTASVWLRASSGTSSIGLQIDSGNETGTASSCVVTTSWRRCSVTQSFTGGSTGTATFIITNGTQTVAVWGAQLEKQSTLGIYVRTDGAAITATGRGLVMRSAGPHLFQSGNVGIGTTSPNNLLQVADLVNFDNTDYGTFLGYQAGNLALTGDYNTALGYQAAAVLTSGYENTAVGYRALYSDQGGFYNTAVGMFALRDNVSGNNNTAAGRYALYLNTASGNTAFGAAALASNISGTGLVAVGYDALLLSTGNNNTAVGQNAGSAVVAGSGNTFLGYNANASAAGLTNASAIGYNAVVAANNSIVLGTTSPVTYVGIGDSDPAELLTVGSGDKFMVNSSGDVISNFTQLDGSTATSALQSTPSTSMAVTSGAGFNDGNYVRVVSSGVNCSGSLTTCYAKITGGGGTNTLIISPALAWSSGALVTEWHVPEIGGTDLAQTLTNRYGRGYFIDGIVTGNASTYYTDAGIFDASGAPLLSLKTGGEVTFSGNIGIGTTTPLSRLTIQSANSEATLGGELITNGTFATDPTGQWNWTPSYWSWNGVSERMDHASGGGDALTQVIPNIEADAAYRVRVQVHTNAYRNGRGWDLSFGNDWTEEYYTEAGDQGYLEAVMWPEQSGNVTLYIGPNGLEGWVDNVTVTKVTPVSAITVMNDDGTVGGDIFVGGAVDDYNVTLGYHSAIALLDGAEHNVSVGKEAGKSLTSGSDNVSIGYQAQRSASTAWGNVALGYQSLYGNMTGSENIGIGVYAGYGITTGDENICIGWYSCSTGPVTGVMNTAVGPFALDDLTSGDLNTAIGYDAFYTLTTGYGNTAIGEAAGASLKTGYDNVFVGHDSNVWAPTGQSRINAMALGQGSYVFDDHTVAIGSNSAIEGVRVGINSAGSGLSVLTVRPPSDYSLRYVDSSYGWVYITTTANASTAITTAVSNPYLTYKVAVGDRIALSSSSSTFATVTGVTNTQITVDAPLGDGTSQNIIVKRSLFNVMNTGGASQLFVSDQGNIGIGTNQPIAQLSLPARTPVVAGSRTTGNAPRSVFVQGRYAYVTNQSANALQIFDISDPTSIPAAVGSVAVGNGPWGVHVQGRYAYTANSSGNSISIVDVSNPSLPTVVGTQAVGTTPRYVFVAGRYAYVTNNGSNTMQVIDVGDPAAPQAIGGPVATGTGPEQIFVQDRYAYLVNYSSRTLQVFDVSNPASPTLVGTSASCGASCNPRGIYVQGRYAYTLDNTSQYLLVYNVGNPSSPTLAGSASTGGQQLPAALYVQDRYAYTVNFQSNSLQVFDVSAASAPKLVSTLATGGGSPNSIHIQGRYAFVANWNGNNLQVFDLGGAYLQQLEAGGIEAGTLAVQGGIQALDGSFRGGVTIGDSLNVSGYLALQNNGYIKGRLGIGTINPTYQLQLSTDSAAKPISNTWTVVSDARLKRDVLPFTEGLETVLAIDPVSYELNGLAGTPEGASGIGVIAQDVEDAIPYTISTYKAKLRPDDAEETELYSFNSSALTFVLINAVKELHAKIEVLTADAEDPLTGSGPVADMQGSLMTRIGGLEGVDGLWSIDGSGKMTMPEIVASAVTAEEMKVRMTDEKKTIGKAVILAGESGVLVQNPAVRETAEVFLTFKKNPGSSWWIDETRDGYFVVKTAQPAGEDVYFSYWIVDVIDATTPPPTEEPPPVEEPAPAEEQPVEPPADIPPAEEPPPVEEPAPETALEESAPAPETEPQPEPAPPAPDPTPEPAP